MGTYVALQAIKAMIKNGFTIKDNVITILGFTFKENVIDIRNTRVIDIVKTLQEYQMDVQLHDPLADKREAFDEYGVKLVERTQSKAGQAVILAVAHAQYKQAGWQCILPLLVGNKGVVFDVTGCLDRNDLPPDINLIRF